MSNSSLVSYTKISPNKTHPRRHIIDTITIHCMAGNPSIEGCGDTFQKENGSSSNYGIGSDGRIGLYVDEGDRSWATSSASNDNRAITIEVANTSREPDWPVSDKAYESLILLVTDICKRNNIKKLLWEGDRNLIGYVSRQNMTVHRWFTRKSCPGNYLYYRHSDIARRVNNNLEKGEDENMDGKDILNKLNQHLATLPTSEYAKESSRKAVKSGLFTDGDKNGLIDNPQGLITREQLVVILNRAGLLDK